MRMRWDSQYLGVQFTGADGHSMLIGAIWHEQMTAGYPGEPSRALIFTSRRAARAWCQAKRASYVDRSDCCAKWRFTPIRVQETVRPAMIRLTPQQAKTKQWKRLLTKAERPVPKKAAKKKGK